MLPVNSRGGGPMTTRVTNELNIAYLKSFLRAISKEQTKAIGKLAEARKKLSGPEDKTFLRCWERCAGLGIDVENLRLFCLVFHKDVSANVRTEIEDILEESLCKKV